jgi:hypothetical protein
VSLAADVLLVSNPLPRDRAVAELLAAIAGTWDQHPNFVHDHALAIARTVPAPASSSTALCDTCGHPGITHPEGGFCTGKLPYGEACGCDDYEPAEEEQP